MVKKVFIDTETTGKIPTISVPKKRGSGMREEQLQYDTDYMKFPYIVSMAWKVNDAPTKHFIINQNGREIPEEATRVHGITTEEANKSPHFLRSVLFYFFQDCQDNDIVIGHNLYYDTCIIKANFLRLLDQCGEKDQEIWIKNYQHIENILHKDKRVDTMRAASKMCKGWSKLTELHQKLFNCGFDAHNAENDVEATYRCYVELEKRGIICQKK